MAKTYYPAVLVNTSTKVDDDFGKILRAMFPTVHAIDGPCVLTAPPGEPFTEASHWGGMVNRQITCEACKVWVRLCITKDL